MTLNEVLSGSPGQFFLGVVELENTQIIGIIDDPVGIELTAVRLGYPLEFAQKWEETDVALAILVPEAGVPDELVIDAGAVAIHSGRSPFGQQYFENLKVIARIAPRKYKAVHLSRNQMRGGTADGPRQRP